jgi:hypothetical protein
MPLLDRIKVGKVRMPLRMVVHGPPGVGKSTFAAGSESPVFIDADRRTNHLDVARFEPESWTEMANFLNEVRLSSTYKTVVLDTLDHIDLLMTNHVLFQHKKSNLEEVGGGYGKGYKFLLDEWKRLLLYLEALRGAGKHVIMLAHSQVKPFKNPLGEDYDVYQLKLYDKASALLRERSDLVGFATFDDTGIIKKGALKAKAAGGQERELHFGHSPAYESKKGFDLPDTLELDWTQFQLAVDKFHEDK